MQWDLGHEVCEESFQCRVVYLSGKMQWYIEHQLETLMGPQCQEEAEEEARYIPPWWQMAHKARTTVRYIWQLLHGWLFRKWGSFGTGRDPNWEGQARTAKQGFFLFKIACDFMWSDSWFWISPLPPPYLVSPQSCYPLILDCSCCPGNPVIHVDFFYFWIVLRQRKLEMTPVRRLPSRGYAEGCSLSLSPPLPWIRAISSYLLLLSLSDHAEEEGNKICFITCFYMTDPSRAISISKAVSISKDTLIFWHQQPA